MRALRPAPVAAAGRGLRAALVAALLSVLAPAAADQNDPRLDDLFVQLRDAPGPVAAALVEAEIWRVWLDSGRDDVDRVMEQGILAMSSGELESAIAAFARVIELAPDFAEGWNKRATAYYLDDQLAASVADIRATLALEPRHFGALSGMGLIFLESGDPRGALEAFEAVLDVHPNSPGARVRVEALRERVRPKGT